MTDRRHWAARRAHEADVDVLRAAFDSGRCVGHQVGK